MRKKMLKNMEWGILVCTILLIVIGLVALFSATQNSGHGEFIKQIIWLAISIPIAVVVLFTDYELIAKISPAFYGGMIVLLIGVLFTNSINGAHSWFDIGFFSLQPSEFMKIFFVLTFASVVSKIQERGKNEISRPTRLIMVLAVAALPIGLIILEPDLGTAMSFIVATLMVLFSANIDKRYIITGILLIVILAPILYFFVLPEHAKTRIDVFLNPDLDPRGSGYNIIQSKLAIGAGQLFGMGLLKGNQTQLGFLYPKTTDFIYSVIGEELGFVATVSIVIIYTVLITKAIYVAKTAKDDLGSYIAIGIVGIFLFHMIENIGMTIGLLPITGVPLPFVSYGGSSLISSSVLIALLLNISGKRQKIIFVE